MASCGWEESFGTKRKKKVWKSLQYKVETFVCKFSQFGYLQKQKGKKAWKSLHYKALAFASKISQYECFS